MNKRLAITFGVGAGLALLLSRRRSNSDAELLAQMLIAETGFSRNQDEMAQIVYVAINRAKKYGRSIASVVSPPGSPVWNTGAAYRERFNEAPDNPRFEAATAFAQKLLSGQGPKNLGATSFVHPSGMPRPPCGAGRVVVGDRCLPEWAVGGRTVGGAVFV